MNKIYKIGNGFIASHLQYDLIEERIEPSIYEMEKIINKYKPDTIINCIGRTGSPNVDWCESNREITSITNTVIPIMFANLCVKFGIKFVHISSGCINYGPPPNRKIKNQISDGMGSLIPVFEENQGWKETDISNPQSFYSKTKLACDLALDGLPGVSILRIRMPVSSKNSPRNLINKLRNYRQLIDIPNSMTFCDDLARCVIWGIDKEIQGIYNVVNPEPTTAVQIMREFQKFRTDHQFEIISEDQLDKLVIAKRSNCILDGTKLKEAGFEMTPTKEALERTMKEFFRA